MEKSQYDLCIEVLRRMDTVGLLKDVVLVGSWCTLFYKHFFDSPHYVRSLSTRDMDLLIAEPRTLKIKTDVAELLKDLGFVVGFTGSQGYIRLENPQLIVEFLVPERGGPINKPYELPQLGLNAQALRFLEFLAQNTIQCKTDSITITLPHPAHFALHKCLVMTRRPKPEKRAKDKEAAIRIFNALIDSGQSDTISEAFRAMPQKWQIRIREQLTDITETNILDVLEG